MINTRTVEKQLTIGGIFQTEIKINYLFTFYVLFCERGKFKKVRFRLKVFMEILFPSN